MAKKRRRADPKTETLRARGTLNPRPEGVTDSLFTDGDFFDSRDLLQVKYEMLRRVRVDGKSIANAAAAFGLSRPTFYEAQARFEREGMLGLVPHRPGPRHSHKLTEEVVLFIDSCLEADVSSSSAALVDAVKQRFGLSVHPRSIERAMSRREKKL